MMDIELCTGEAKRRVHARFFVGKDPLCNGVASTVRATADPELPLIAEVTCTNCRREFAWLRRFHQALAQ